MAVKVSGLALTSEDSVSDAETDWLAAVVFVSLWFSITEVAPYGPLPVKMACSKRNWKGNLTDTHNPTTETRAGLGHRRGMGLPRLAAGRRTSTQIADLETRQKAQGLTPRSQRTKGSAADQVRVLSGPQLCKTESL
jgi:hypothetical protein